MAETNQRILLIDDDRESCDLLRDYLAAEGYCIESVHDGETGAQRAVEGEYDLVVLDVMLPRLNGFEVLRRIRAVSSVWRWVPTTISPNRSSTGNCWPASGRSSAA